jgi:hypothetical protein
MALTDIKGGPPSKEHVACLARCDSFNHRHRRMRATIGMRREANEKYLAASPTAIR